MTPDAPPLRADDLTLVPLDVDAQAACVAALVRAATVCTVYVDGCLDEARHGPARPSG